MNEQTMLLEYNDALIRAKKRFQEEFVLDTSLSPEKQTEMLLTQEVELMAEETIPIFKKWLDEMKEEILSEIS